MRALLPAIQVPTTGEMLRDSRTITLDPDHQVVTRDRATGVRVMPTSGLQDVAETSALDGLGHEPVRARFA
ncbi:hypothetical protein, partial [Actinoplanes sp. NBRC 103695]|uniref:hypothetical protein n=1 Tax=Actinoplanes sp. NBRC 103695 TaxID=3032202 RepID=UPI0025564AF7